MNEQLKCPVCGTVNTRTYDTIEVGLCEDHYFCKHCGYFYELAYSPAYEGICYPVNIFKRLKMIPVWLSHLEVVDRLKLVFYREDRCP